MNIYNNPQENRDLLVYIADFIPINSGEFKFVQIKGNTARWSCELICRFHRQECIDNFIRSYLLLNNETLRVSNSKKCGEKSPYIINRYYRCHHDTRHEATRDSNILTQNPSKRFKNTYCPFSLSVKVHKNKTDFPCTITINYVHNHPIHSLQALNFKDIPINVQNKVENLFENNLSPSGAYYEFLCQLRADVYDEIQFHLLKSDRSVCPKRRDFNAIYKRFCENRFGGKNGGDLFMGIEEKVRGYKEKYNSSIAYQEYDKDCHQPLIITFITPLMLRIHEQVQQASELVFIDSSSNMDEHNMRIFVICTHSSVGALPLGVIITSDEQTETLISAFKMFQAISPSFGFYGKGYPQVVMTDNCSELREALSECFPSTTLLLCTFHILQQVWRWLFDRKHGVSADDRVELMKQFRQLVHAPTVEVFNLKESEFFKSKILRKYENAVRYFLNLVEEKASWSKCFRTNLRIRGSNTNNYVESQFLVLKDTVLRRQRQFNVVQLLERLFDDFENHFKLRLLSVADGSFDGVYSKRFIGSCKNSSFKLPTDKEREFFKTGFARIGDNLFSLPSRSNTGKFYMVDMSIGICECFIGQDGSPCAHQYFLWSENIADSINFVPIFNQMERKKFAEIALGSSLPLHYYRALHAESALNRDQTSSSVQSSTQINDNRHEIEENSKMVAEPSTRKNTKVNENDQKETLTLLEKTFNSMRERVNDGDKNFCKAVEKFSKSYFKMNDSQNISSLSCYGKTFLQARARGKIRVQPTAVARRKYKNGSRNKIDTTSKASLPQRVNKPKRKHKLAANINKNQPAAKKSKSSMH